VILKKTPHLKGDWFAEESFLAKAEWLTWASEDKELYCYTKVRMMMMMRMVVMMMMVVVVVVMSADDDGKDDDDDDDDDDDSHDDDPRLISPPPPFPNQIKNSWTCTKCGEENPIVSPEQANTLVWEMRCSNSCSMRSQTLRSKV
jgi:hypothetical protein